MACCAALGALAGAAPAMATISIAPATTSVTEGNSGTQSVGLSVSRSCAFLETSGPASVDVITSPGSATPGSDYDASPSPGHISFAGCFLGAGSATEAVSVTVNGDTVTESDESFSVSLVNESGTGVGNRTSTITITNDDAAPVATIGTASAAEGTGTGGVLHFPVQLNHASSKAVSVPVSLGVLGDTATAASDYNAASGTVTIPAGQTSGTFDVPLVGDAIDEDNETVTAKLGTPTNATLGSPSSAVGTILDDDAAPTVSIGGTPQVTEGGNLVFPVSLSGASGRDVTVSVAVTGGSASAADYTAPAGTLTIPKGQTSGSVTVATVNDALDEDDETLTVSISSPVNATLGTSASATGTILDNDAAPAVSIEDASSVSEGGTLGYRINLTAASGRDVTVPVSVTGGSASAADYSPLPASVTIPKGLTSVTLSVTTVNDSLDEDDETLIVSISSPVNATLGSPTSGTGTINDNDAEPAVSIGDAPPVAEGGTLAYPVTLSAASGKDVSVHVAVTGGTASAADYTAPAATLTIPKGATSGVLHVATTDDALDEDAETLTVSISSPENASLGTPTSGSGTINDNDNAPSVSIGDAPAAAEGQDLVFPVTLSAVSGQSVSVHVAVTGGSASAADYTPPAATLVIPAGSTTGSVHVPTTDDAIDEDNETVTVTISSPVNATIGTPASGTGTISDGDTPPSVTIGDAAAANEGQTMAFPINLSEASGRDVTVSVAVGGGTASAGDFTAPAATLTIPKGATFGLLLVATTDDALDEDDETLTATISSPVNATLGPVTSGTGTIVDNDNPPSIAIGDAAAAPESGTLSFPVALDAVSGRDVTVSVAVTGGTASAGDYTAPAATFTIPKGQAAGTITVPAVDDSIDEDDETVTVSISNAVNATLSSATSGTGTITDNDGPPAVSVAGASSAEGNSGDGTMSFAVTLSHPSIRPITVAYSTADGTAKAGEDYEAAQGTLTFAPLDTSREVTVTTHGDTTVESDETFSMTLSSPTNATLGSATATGTITDDDQAPSTGGGGGGGGSSTPTGGAGTPTTTTTTSTPSDQSGTAGAGDTTKAGDTVGPRVALAPLTFTRPRNLTVVLTCPAGEKTCRGQLTVFTVASKKSKIKRLRKELKLGTKVFVVPGGKKATITIRLSSSMQKLLRQAGRISARAYAVVRDNAGNVATAQRNGTLRYSSAKKSTKKSSKKSSKTKSSKKR